MPTWEGKFLFKGKPNGNFFPLVGRSGGLSFEELLKTMPESGAVE